MAQNGETCGPIVNKKCASGLCCSGSNFCGTGVDFCGKCELVSGEVGEVLLEKRRRLSIEKRRMAATRRRCWGQQKGELGAVRWIFTFWLMDISGNCHCAMLKVRLSLGKGNKGNLIRMCTFNLDIKDHQKKIRSMLSTIEFVSV